MTKIYNKTKQIVKKLCGDGKVGNLSNKKYLLAQESLQNINLLKSLDNERSAFYTLLVEAWRNYLLQTTSLNKESEDNCTLKSLLDSFDDNIPQNIKDSLIKMDDFLTSGEETSRIKKKEFRKAHKFLEKKLARVNSTCFFCRFIKKFFLFIFSLFVFILISYFAYFFSLKAQYFFRAPWQVNLFLGEDLQKEPYSSEYLKEPYIKDYFEKKRVNLISVSFKSCLNVPFEMNANFSFKSQGITSFYIDGKKVYEGLNQVFSSVNVPLLAGKHEVLIELVNIRDLQTIDLRIDPYELQENLYQLSNDNRCE